MADQFAEQFKRYWVVIVVVAGVAFGLGSFNAVTLARISELDSKVSAFVGVGPRYSLQMHYTYAERQQEIDARQNERLAILEQQMRTRGQ
jgi:hypothetical protein